MIVENLTSSLPFCGETAPRHGVKKILYLMFVTACDVLSAYFFFFLESGCKEKVCQSEYKLGLFFAALKRICKSNNSTSSRCLSSVLRDQNICFIYSIHCGGELAISHSDSFKATFSSLDVRN